VEIVGGGGGSAHALVSRRLLDSFTVHSVGGPFFRGTQEKSYEGTGGARNEDIIFDAGSREARRRCNDTGNKKDKKS
jgi:hypothetical protein